MKVLIIYDSKYGHNKQVAQALADFFSEGNNEVQVHHAKEFPPKDAAASQPDMFLFGGPNRAGMVSFTIKSWVSKFTSAIKTAGPVAKAAAWSTHVTNDDSTPKNFSWARIAPKWDALLAKVPAGKATPPVQGIEVKGMEGPLVDGWKETVLAFARRVAAL